MVKQVNFIIIGAARSATTSISNLLAQHPEVSFSNPKEPQFFSNINWRDNISEYHNLFKKEGKIYGEGSTNYSKHPSFNRNIHSDIFEYNANMKFIYVMRKPIDRIISHYNFAFERGYTNQDINIEVFKKDIYINTCKYMSQIKPYIEHFGKDNVKLIFFDDYKSKPSETINNICSFLNINEISLKGKSLKTNESQKGVIRHKKYDNPKTILDYLKKGIHYVSRSLSSKKPIANLTDKSKTKIIHLLEQEISELEKITQKDLSKWREL